MTKKEFLHEAALRLLATEMTAQEIAAKARELADELFGECTIDMPQVYAESLNEEPIETLLKEIDRIDVEEREERKKQNEREDRWWRSHEQKSGYSVRLTKVFRANNIQTIGDLIRMRSHNFMRLKNVGQKSRITCGRHSVKANTRVL